MSKTLLASLAVALFCLGCNATTVDEVQDEPAPTSLDQPAEEAPAPPAEPAGAEAPAASADPPAAENSAAAATQPPPEPSKSQMLEARLKKIGRAFYEFHSEFGHFPPAASRDAEGKPLLSWRVHLLPFLGHQELYNEFHLDEPWDSPHNRTLLEKMPEEYATGELGESQTSFVVFLGDEAVFGGKRAEGWSRPLPPFLPKEQPDPLKTAASEEEVAASRRRGRKRFGPRVAEMVDGTSNTILVVQAGDDRKVPWTKPDDVPFQPENPVAVLGEVPEAGFLALYGDTRVQLIPRDVAPERLAAAITRAGRD